MEKEKKEKLKKDAKQIVMVAAGTFTAIVIGYKMGWRDSVNATNRGFDVLFKSDPTLKDHFYESLLNYKKSL